MSVFKIAGRDIHVNTYRTPWPASILFKQQGVEVQVNPQRHWWCLWLCTTTDNAKRLEFEITLESAVEAVIPSP